MNSIPAENTSQEHLEDFPAVLVIAEPEHCNFISNATSITYLFKVFQSHKTVLSVNYW